MTVFQLICFLREGFHYSVLRHTVHSQHSVAIVAPTESKILDETSGSHGVQFEDSCLLGCRTHRLLDTKRRFRYSYSLHHQGDEMTKAVSTPETSVSMHQTT